MSRNRRTAFLAVLATVTFVWAAIYQFDVPGEELAWLLFYCVVGVLGVAVLAGLLVGLIILARAAWSYVRRRFTPPASD